MSGDKGVKQLVCAHHKNHFLKTLSLEHGCFCDLSSLTIASLVAHLLERQLRHYQDWTDVLGVTQLLYLLDLLRNMVGKQGYWNLMNDLLVIQALCTQPIKQIIARYPCKRVIQCHVDHSVMKNHAF
jgi:hypothetical protein